MCTVAIKYIEGIGFVGVKNREHTYKPRIRIRKSLRSAIERLYLWEEVTRFSEGINEFGISIISIQSERTDNLKVYCSGTRYRTQCGLRIRKSLYGKNIREALFYLSQMQVTGITAVFNINECVIHEGSFDDDGKYQFMQLDANRYMPLVISDTITETEKDRLSHEIGLCQNSEEMLNTISKLIKEGDNTSGQLMITPNDCTVHYRPIYSKTIYDVERLNSRDQKTFFEIVSSRKLINFT